jgi:hypothetical protein
MEYDLVTDVSALGNVHTLNLYRCTKVTGKNIKNYLNKVIKLTLPNGTVFYR